MYQKTERELNIINHEFMDRIANCISRSMENNERYVVLTVDNEDFSFFFDLFSDKKNELELKLRESK